MRAFALTLLTVPILTISSLAILANEPAQKKLIVRPEVQPLVGTWRPSQGRADGEDLPKEFLALTEIEFDNSGNVHFSPAGGGRDCKITGPGELDLIISLLCSDELTHGIYKLDNDRLTICINIEPKRPRPAEFTAEKGSRRVLFVLQKTQTLLRELDDNEHFKLKKAFYDVKGFERLSDKYRRWDSTSSLHQLGVAFHTFLDDKRAKEFLPHAIYSPDGKTPLLSWRVLLLPYLFEQQGNLYSQFRLNEPWDSENNKKLIEQMPLVYTAPGADPKSGLTYYQVFTGPGTFFDGIKKLNPMDILADSGRSILFVEGGNPVIWTKPEDLVLPEDKKRLPPLGGMFDDGMHVSHIGGDVSFRERPFDPAELRKLIGPQGNRRFANFYQWRFK